MPRPLTLLALGDSLTEGYGLEPDAALPAVLERLLRADGHPVMVVNEGLSGDTTAGGLRRLRAWLARRPGFTNGRDAAPQYFAMVELGANDGFMGLDPQDMTENLAAILTLLAGRRVPTLLAGFKAQGTTDADYALEYDALFPRLAGRFGVPLWPHVLEGIWGVPHLTLWDGLHPNATGVERMAGAALPYVLDMVRAGISETGEP